MYLVILYVASFLDAAYVDTSKCPNPLQVLPCKCQGGFFGLYVSCESALVDQVRGALAEVRKVNQRVFYLTLQHVELPTLPANLFVGLNVHQLKVIECHTSTVDENAFADVAATLQWLQIRNNPLAEVPSQALQKLSILQYLILDDNGIEVLRAEAFKGLHFLRGLSLGGNNIKSIDNFAFVGIGNSLAALNLAGNELTAFPGQPLCNLTILEVLHLQDNKIASLVPEDFDAMAGGSLRTMNLANNTIRHLPARVFRSLKRLSSLNLAGNVIGSVHPSAFEGNEDTLSTLNFRCNRLEEIPAASLRNLRSLYNMDLQDNNICKVRRDDFARYGKHLVYLHLQNNSLTYVDPEAFIGLDVLKSLTLQSNQLNAAPLETYSHVIHTLEMFDIHDNPLHCDCHLSWLANWINGRGSGIVEFANETSCATPRENTKKLLAEIPPDQLVCLYSWPKLPEPCRKSFNNAHGRLSSDVRTTVLQLGFIILITVLGTIRLF